MAVARYQAAASVLYVGERPKAVILQFEEPFSALEWTGLRNDGQGLANWKHQPNRVANRKTKIGRKGRIMDRLTGLRVGHRIGNRLEAGANALECAP